ncbi:MAG: radical SAM protein [bacterium]|nr:radical SAM protein [bacterium]
MAVARLGASRAVNRSIWTTCPSMRVHHTMIVNAVPTELLPVALALFEQPLEDLRTQSTRLEMSPDRLIEAHEVLIPVLTASAENLVDDLFYPYSHAVRKFVTVSGLVARQGMDPSRWGLSTVELHLTLGTCGFRCQMCLWSDGAANAYTTSFGMDRSDLLSPEEWVGLFDWLQANGVKNVVVSGGGEPLLHPFLSMMLDELCDRGMAVDLYTTGSGLIEKYHQFAGSLQRLRRIRFSVHAVGNAKYRSLLGGRGRHTPFDDICQAMSSFVSDRKESLSRTPTLGIGFLAQAGNVDQLVRIFDVGRALGLDFVDLRTDEVETTIAYSNDDRLQLQNALLELCRRHSHSAPPALDVSDKLVAQAFGCPELVRGGTKCFVKYLRPAVTPHGLLQPCDLAAEPRFGNANLTLASIRELALSGRSITDALNSRRINDSCKQCMPNSRTINAAVTKILADAELGLPAGRQILRRLLT